MADNHYDIVAVGTGFATSFFLQKYLEQVRRRPRVLVLEAGRRASQDELLTEGDPEEAPRRWDALSRRQFVNRNPEKLWSFYYGFGGSSIAWYGASPRMIPEDFELRSRYGVGEDWPVTYDDLEPYYSEAERIMAVSGSDERADPAPRSQPYPQPPHRYSVAAEMFKRRHPEAFFPQPSARARVAVRGQRVACCANNVCHLCPVDAKFTILNGFSGLYARDEVELRVGARVERLEWEQNRVREVVYSAADDGRERRVQAELVVLGANALFNPFILQQSGLDHPELGRGLVEQVGVDVDIELAGVQNYQGSNVTSAVGYSFYGGEHRRERAAMMIQVDDRVRVSAAPGKWLSRVRLVLTYEDLRQAGNYVAAGEGGRPETHFGGYSPYCGRGLDHLPQDVEALCQGLPVESWRVAGMRPSESHIMGTTVMGNNAETSVVDARSVHHRLRNLVVLGSGNFPTAAPANPTLTLAALALQTAEELSG